jgi:hypothetical protein
LKQGWTSDSLACRHRHSRVENDFEATRNRRELPKRVTREVKTGQATRRVSSKSDLHIQGAESKKKKVKYREREKEEKNNNDVRKERKRRV